MLGAADGARANSRLNELLCRLPADEFELIEPSLRIATLSSGEALFDDGEPSDTAYFPLTAIISMIAQMRDGDEIEYGSIGREGMVGLHFALAARPLRGRAVCQLGGAVACLPRPDLERLPRTGPDSHLFALLLRYAQSTINVLAQSTACNALHSVRERTARWLLTSCDRAGSDDLKLTQEFLSKMLGVRRAGVSNVAGDFQREGIIRQTRGRIRVLNRRLLHDAACECYDLVRAEYDSVLDG